MTASSFGPHGEPEFKDGDAPDVALNPTQVGKYAALVGNRRVGTTAQRNAALTEDPTLSTPGSWNGLEWWDTTLKRAFILVDGGWAAELHRGGSFFDVVAADGTTQVSHGLGTTPTDVQITRQSHPSNDQISRYFQPVLFGMPSATRFNVRLLDSRTQGWADGQQTVRFSWHAYAAM
jgi:hypothetical protein